VDDRAVAQDDIHSSAPGASTADTSPITRRDNVGHRGPNGKTGSEEAGSARLSSRCQFTSA
jgi:hypothetical protein